MKKLYILCAAALGLAFTACDEVEESTAVPQEWPQESPFYADNITVTPDAGTINIAALNADNTPATVATMDVTGAPAGYTVVPTLEIAKSEDFAAPVVVECTIDADGTVSVEPDALQNAYYTNITKDPAAVTIYARYAAYAVNGTSKVRMGGADYYYGPYAMNIVPLPAAKVLADSYTLEVATAGDWANATSYAFSNTGISPYDDPVFSLNAQFPDADFAAGLQWRVVNSLGQVFGPAGANDEDGDLFEADVTGNMLSNPISMTMNVQDMTYSYIAAYAFFYTPGDANGWSAAASQKVTTTNYDDYSGLVVITGTYGFKFNPDTDWLGHDFGLNGSLTESVAEDGTISYTGTVNGTENIIPGQQGLYYVTLNYTTRDLKLTYIASLGVIGDFNNWGGDVAMTPSADFLTWTSDEFEMTEGQTWKIRANGAWADSWGSSIDDLQYNGGNITCTESGKYILTLNVASVPYTATLTKQP